MNDINDINDINKIQICFASTKFSYSSLYHHALHSSNYTALARAAVEGDETALDMFGTWNKSGMGNSLLSQVDTLN